MIICLLLVLIISFLLFQIHEQREFLQFSLDEWNEFDSVATPLNEWIERVEIDVLHRDTYGKTLEESEQYMRRVVVSNLY